MKKYREFLSSIHNGLAYRENIEWTNTWYDSANRISDKRYLIIGDSTARMVRSTFAKFIQYPVDMIGCSSSLDDEIFVNTIDSFFNNTQYKYDAIFVQIGHHGRINKSGSPYSKEDYYKFEQDYRALLNFLFQHTSKIIAESIFDAIIPCKYPKIKNILISINAHRLFYKLGIMKEKPDNEINKVTHRKNQIIRDLISSTFNSQNINYYDINLIMKNSNYAHIDHIHFEEKAKYYIAAQMATNLLHKNY